MSDTNYRDIFLRMPMSFWACFYGELCAVLGMDVLQVDPECESNRAIDYVTGTCAWNVALRSACKRFELIDFYKWYDSLDWMQSDEFDCDLVDELVDHVVERGEETRHAYYEWLVKNSLSLIEKLLSETGLAT